MENSKEKRFKRPLGQLGTGTANSKFVVGLRPSRSIRPEFTIKVASIRPKGPIVPKSTKKSIGTSENE